MLTSDNRIATPQANGTANERRTDALHNNPRNLAWLIPSTLLVKEAKGPVLMRTVSPTLNINFGCGLMIFNS